MSNPCDSALLKVAEQLELFALESTEPVSVEPELIYTPYITIKGVRRYRPDGKMWCFPARPGWKRRNKDGVTEK